LAGIGDLNHDIDGVELDEHAGSQAVMAKSAIANLIFIAHLFNFSS
jgi:hypothetical protein